MSKEITTSEEWLGKENKLGVKICDGKYIHPDETFTEMVYRVCGGNPAAMRLMLERKFLPAGRTITNRGRNNAASLSNCYSAGYVPDDYHGILDLNTKIGLTYKYQGGQGVSLSNLRPKGAPIAGGEYVSDGIVPFMELFNQTTLSTSQGGARKGALLMSLSCWHKEIEDFINIKSKEGVIEAANLSVEIDDEFMSAVKEYYDTGKMVEKTITKQYGPNNAPITYTITPIEIYKAMMRRAYDWGDPGCIFTEQFRNHNLMQFCDDYKIITGNPCGEQALAAHAACNLGSINLAEFVSFPFTSKAEFDYDGFCDAVNVAVEVLDDVVTEGIDRHPLLEQREQARNYRNIGLGFMGLADSLIMLGLTYGSPDAIRFLDQLGYKMFRTAVLRSHELAKERGAFPAYHKELFDSDIIKDHFSNDEREAMRGAGLRNCSLLSIAPTGSIGTMLNVSTGIEPYFAFHYQRTTKSLEGGVEKVHDVEADIVKRYCLCNGDGPLPTCFMSSTDIPWRARIDMQAVAQRHIDTAISSTVNLPADVSLEDVEKLYLYAWSSKLKGITIFRSGCKRAAILNTDSVETAPIKQTTLSRGDIIECSDGLVGKKRKLTTGCGSLHCLAYFEPTDGSLQEVYLSKGSTGGCANFMTGLSRTISLLCRAGVDVYSIKDQLDSTGACPSYASRTVTKKDTSRGSCCPMAIGNAIAEMYEEMQDEVSDGDEPLWRQSTNTAVAASPTAAICPECGGDLLFEGGCNSCPSCGYSKCG